MASYRDIRVFFGHVFLSRSMPYDYAGTRFVFVGHISRHEMLKHREDIM